jgi:hypothetical protein
MIGGPGRVRTDDLFHAMEARSQLRHRPTEEEPIDPEKNDGPNITILAYPLRLVKPCAIETKLSPREFYENFENGYAEGE